MSVHICMCIGVYYVIDLSRLRHDGPNDILFDASSGSVFFFSCTSSGDKLTANNRQTD
jgi:hypothetical protein